MSIDTSGSISRVGIAPLTHQTPDERAAVGRAARRAVPRSSHATFDGAAEGRDPVAMLLDQETTRVPELVPLRHERMLVSPFTFFRGAAVIMAADLATVPDSGLTVQACGDAHLANFGGFGSPDRELVFDINDFDETSPGPFEWDLKRLAASFEIAARSRDMSSATAREVVLTVSSAYRSAMQEFAGMTNLGVWYARLDAHAVLERWRSEVSGDDAKRFERSATKAQSKDSMKALNKLTELVDGEYRIVNDPPVITRIGDVFGDEGVEPDQIFAWLRDRFRLYRASLPPDRQHLLETYRLVDFARKVVGVGSVGTRCWIALLLGKDDTDPLFLQIKEAQSSVLEPYAGFGAYPTHGQRVVEGQRLLQSASDILLGWVRTEGVDGVDRDFYVRQLWDWKISMNLETISPAILRVYAQMCGWTLARGHARSGDRIAIAAYLGTGDVFDRALADFAVSYADQNERDYDTVKAALSATA
jgi:uncharacterized protein (DUF2252 family)